MRKYLLELLQAFLIPFTHYDYQFAGFNSFEIEEVKKPMSHISFKSLFGGAPAQTLPAPAAVIPAPTVDEAEQNVISDQTQAAKKGAMSTLLNTSAGSTSDDLDASAPETTLKRFLGS